MRILICDDEIEVIRKLRSIIVKFFKTNNLNVPEIQFFTNGEQLISAVTSKDIIFLDIEMPDYDGIYIGNQIKKSNPDAIIFVITSHIEYLDDAMRFKVFRYISKPIDEERLFANLNDALQTYYSNSATVAIETKEGVYMCPVTDIILVAAKDRKIYIHTKEKTYISTNNMEYWIVTLTLPCFFNSHRSYIVNIKYVDSFDHENISLLHGKYTAYMSQRKYSDFKKAYFNYLETIG